MPKRERLREGKTQGGVKDLPDGPRPDIGPPPPQKPKEPTLDLVINFGECLDYLEEYGGTLSVRNDRHARYQFKIPGLLSVQYADFNKTCREFAKIMARHKAGLPLVDKKT